MFNLVRKELLTTRWVQLAGLVIGLALIPLYLTKPDSILTMILLSYLMYMHLVFNQSRYAAASRVDNLLLNSLPLTRRQVVTGKYCYVWLSAMVFSTYLCLIALFLTTIGLRLPLSILILCLLMALVGILYHALLMPLSYLDARYGTWASMLIYMAIILLPQTLGKGNFSPALNRFFTQLTTLIHGWNLPVFLIATLAVLGYTSIRISWRVYENAEF
ncbi:MAG: ABC-2 transporter permease [Bacillota bacterium]|nr:ABC-2 transporter permease [Bacillota bacterium]